MNTITTPLPRRWLWASALCVLPLAAQAQVLRCTDARGQPYYTDQPCPNAVLVAPARTEQERLQDSLAAERARQQLEDARQQVSSRPPVVVLPAPTPPLPPSPAVALADSLACRQARDEAAFRASVATRAEEIRTARHNAALACGQTPPTEVVVVQQPQPATVWAPVAPVMPRPAPPVLQVWGGSGGFGFMAGSPGWYTPQPVTPIISPRPVHPPARFGVPVHPHPRTVGTSPDPSMRFPYRPHR